MMLLTEVMMPRYLNKSKAFTPLEKTTVREQNSLTGFTLLELIIVVLIVSVLTALSTPMFKKTFLNMQFERSCSDLNSVLNYAWQSAIFDRIEYRVVLDSNKSMFWLEKRPLAGLAGKFQRPEGRFARVYSLPESVHFSCDKEAIIFYPDGRSDKVTIKVKNIYTIQEFTTQGTSGYVKIK